jgi:PAS domain S-box-containing protein
MLTAPRQLDTPDVIRLRRRALWFPTLIFAVLLAFDGLLDTFVLEPAGEYALLAHFAFVIPACLGAYFSARCIFRLIRRDREEIVARGAAILQMERRFRAIFEQAAVGVGQIDADTGIFLRVNQRYCDILGYSRPELEGLTERDLTHSDDLQGGLDLVRRLLAGEIRVFAIEQRYRRKDGTPVWVNFTASPMWNPGERPTCYVAVVEDITVRKHSIELLGWKGQIDAALAELYRALTSPSTSHSDLADLILDRALSLTESEHGYVASVDPKTQRPIVRTVLPGRDAERNFLDEHLRPPLPPGQAESPESLWGFPLHGQEPFFTNTPASHPAYLGPPIGVTPIRRFLSVPVLLDRRFVGQIALANSSRDYSHRDLAAIRRLADFYVLSIQRKRTEEEIQSIARFPHEDPHPTLRLREDGTILYANPASAPILQTWNAAVAGPAPPPWIEMARAALASEAIRTTDVQFEGRVYTFSFVPVRHTGYVNLYGRDITERRFAERALRRAHDELEVRVQERTEELWSANRLLKREIGERRRTEERLRSSHEQLRALAAHLVSVQEQERIRIAREIHDQLGQMLTGLKFDLSWLGGRLPTDLPPLREKVRGMSGLVDETIKSVRRLATELRPGILDDLGLVPAIEWQVQEFQARTGIRCSLATELIFPDQDQERRTAMFRILQEALTNVARHAGAATVSITLKEDDAWLELRVEDDGRGITDPELADRRSLGLLGMRERARLLDGEVAISGRPGAGTTISARIPVLRTAPVSPEAVPTASGRS